MDDFAINVFFQRPDAGLNREVSDIRGIFGIETPTRGARCQRNNETRAGHFCGFFNFARQIERFGADDGCDICRFVRRPDGKQVFFETGIAQ